MSVTETQLQNAIMDALKDMGVWVIRSAVSVKRGYKSINTGEPGQPDLCLPVYGWGEVKLPGKDLDPDQVLWHERAKREGVRVATWWSIADAVMSVQQWKQELLHQRMRPGRLAETPLGEFALEHLRQRLANVEPLENLQAPGAALDTYRAAPQQPKSGPSQKLRGKRRAR